MNKKAAQPKRFIPLVVSSNLAAQKKDQFSHSDPHISAADFLEDNKFEFVFPNGTRLLIRDQIDLAFLQSIAHLYDCGMFNLHNKLLYYFPSLTVNEV